MATGTGNLPNQNMDFVPLATLPAADLDKLVDNIESLADGTGIGDGAVNAAKMLNGIVKTRQGGSATVWSTAGTTTYDVSAADVVTQCGTFTPTALSTTITFPTAYTYAPIVVASPMGIGGLTAQWYIVPSNTQFTFVSGDYTRTTPVMWIAIGI